MGGQHYDVSPSPPLGFLASMPGFNSKNRVLPTIPDHAKKVTGRRMQHDTARSAPVVKKVPQEDATPVLPPLYESPQLRGREAQRQEGNGFHALQGSLNKLLFELQGAMDDGKSLDARWQVASQHLDILLETSAKAPAVVHGIDHILGMRRPTPNAKAPPPSHLPETMVALDLLLAFANTALPCLGGIAMRVRTALFDALKLPGTQPPERSCDALLEDVRPSLNSYRDADAAWNAQLLKAFKKHACAADDTPQPVAGPVAVRMPAGPAVGRAISFWQRSYLEWVFEKWREVVKFTKVLRKIASERDDLKSNLRVARRSIVDIEMRAESKDKWDGVWKLEQAQKDTAEAQEMHDLMHAQHEIAVQHFAEEKARLEQTIADQSAALAESADRVKETTSAVENLLPAVRVPDDIHEMHRVVFQCVYQNNVDPLNHMVSSRDSLMRAFMPSFVPDAQSTPSTPASVRSTPASPALSNPDQPRRATFVEEQAKPPVQDDEGELQYEEIPFATHVPSMPAVDVTLGISGQELYDILGETDTETGSRPNMLFRSVLLCMGLHKVITHDLDTSLLHRHMSVRRNTRAGELEKPIVNEIVDRVSKAVRQQAERTRACIKLVQMLLWMHVIREHRVGCAHRERRLSLRKEEQSFLRELTSTADEAQQSREVMRTALDRCKAKTNMDEQDEVYLMDMLEESKGRLMDIYRYYASCDFRAMDTVLSKEEMELFLQDCRLSDFTSRRKSTRRSVGRASLSPSARKVSTLSEQGDATMLPVDFIESLLLLAHQKRDGRRVYQSFAALMEGNISPNASFVCGNEFRKQVVTADTQAVLKQHRQALFALYQRYSFGNKNGLDWKGFKKMMDECHVPDDTITHYTLQQVFIKMKSTAHTSVELYKSFAELQVDMCVLAVYRTPAPYVPLSVKVRQFLLNLLKPDS